MISTGTNGHSICRAGRNVRNAADHVSPLFKRADPGDCRIEDAPVEIRALQQLWPYHNCLGEGGRAALAAKGGPKRTSQRGSRALPSRPLAFTTFRSGATVRPVICCVISPGLVRHSRFDLRLEFLRLLHDGIELRKHFRQFFGGEFGHRRDCNDRVTIELMSLPEWWVGIDRTNHRAPIRWGVGIHEGGVSGGNSG